MNQPLFRLDSREGTVLNERRRTRRSRVWTGAMLESSKGDRQEVSLSDVSHYGCCVSGDADWIRLGAFVSVSLGDNPALQAIVRWTRDGSAGMEFLRPVPAEREEWFDLMD